MKGEKHGYSCDTRGERAVDAKTLKADMQKVTDDFSAVMRSIGEQSRGTLIEGKEKLVATFENWREAARVKFSDAYKRMNKLGKEAVEESRRKISSRPFTVLFTALASGVIAGALLRRSR